MSRLVMPPAAPSFPPCRKRRGRKGALGRVWCVLRVRFRQVLIFGYYEHTDSPYGRFGTRRLLWCTKFVNSCDSISAVKTPFVQNLQGSTVSPKISVKPIYPAGGQSRPPLRITEALKFRRRGRRLCRPEKCNEFAENSRKNGASQAAFFTPVGRLRFYTRSLPLPPA